MTLRRALGLSVAGVMVLLGALWTGQGLGWIGGSSMSGQDEWAIIGPLVGGLGVALGIVIVGNARRDRHLTDLDRRYGGKR
jgi:apolipoprotein N-acyltransferase